MEIKAEEFLYKLQHKQELQSLGRVLTVFGEEDYYRQQIVAAVPEALFEQVAPEDRQISVFDKDTDLYEFASAINTYPFFCGQSLVILKDEKLLTNKAESDAKKQQLDKLAGILSDVPDYCTVLISASKLDKRTKLFKLLKKDGLVCECQSIRPYELTPWLDAQAEAYGAHWQRDAIGVILEYLAPVEKAPLQLLQREIAKLAIYVGERKTWTKEDVENIFSALPEASNFALLNFIAEGNLLECLQLLGAEKKKGTNILPVCAMIMFKLRQMLQFMELRRQGYGQKEAAAELKLHPYAAKKMQEQCRRFSEAKLRDALLELTQLNVDLRSGGREYSILEEILLRLLA